jgi:hypothetical protein
VVRERGFLTVVFKGEGVGERALSVDEWFD